MSHRVVWTGPEQGFAAVSVESSEQGGASAAKGGRSFAAALIGVLQDRVETEVCIISFKSCIVIN
jgi:hypothetical protein